MIRSESRAHCFYLLFVFLTFLDFSGCLGVSSCVFVVYLCVTHKHNPETVAS